MTTTSFLGNKPVRPDRLRRDAARRPGRLRAARDPDAARAVLRRAVELGVDHIDTSQYYGPDVVNDLIREALHPYPDDLKLVTKVGARRDDAGGVAVRAVARGAAGRRRGQPALAGVERMDLVNLRVMGDDGAPVSPSPSSSARSRTSAARASSTSSGSRT